jgi:hypothetical protein
VPWKEEREGRREGRREGEREGGKEEARMKSRREGSFRERRWRREEDVKEG